MVKHGNWGYFTLLTGIEWGYTLPETNSKRTWKIGLPNRKVVFQPSICRGELLVSGSVTPINEQKRIGNWGYSISPYLLGSRVIGLPNHFPYEGFNKTLVLRAWNQWNTWKEIIGNLRAKCLDMILSSEDRGSLYIYITNPNHALFNGKSLKLPLHCLIVLYTLED